MWRYAHAIGWQRGTYFGTPQVWKKRSEINLLCPYGNMAITFIIISNGAAMCPRTIIFPIYWDSFMSAWPWTKGNGLFSPRMNLPKRFFGRPTTMVLIMRALQVITGWRWKYSFSMRCSASETEGECGPWDPFFSKG